MPFPLITQGQLASHLSQKVIQRIYDDKRTGEASGDAVSLLLRNSSSKVLGALTRTWPVAEIRAMSEEEIAGQDELIRVTLDQARAMAAQRHPEIMQIDWYELMKIADRDLEKLRTAIHGLGVDPTESPEPPNNIGRTALEDGDEPSETTFGGSNWGNF